MTPEDGLHTISVLDRCVQKCLNVGVHLCAVVSGLCSGLKYYEENRLTRLCSRLVVVSCLSSYLHLTFVLDRLSFFSFFLGVTRTF